MNWRTALARIPFRNASAPVEASLGRFEGKYLEWSVPDDAHFQECDTDSSDSLYDGRSQSGHFFESWVSPTGVDRSEQGPGQIDRLWIMDVDGIRIVIDAWFMPSAQDDDRAALSSALESIEIVAPDR